MHRTSSDIEANRTRAAAVPDYCASSGLILGGPTTVAAAHHLSAASMVQQVLRGMYMCLDCCDLPINEQYYTHGTDSIQMYSGFGKALPPADDINAAVCRCFIPAALASLFAARQRWRMALASLYDILHIALLPLTILHHFAGHAAFFDLRYTLRGAAGALRLAMHAEMTSDAISYCRSICYR
eukprot:scaffold184841_cov21-Prasinocladus_malaysianus.AAC.2